MAYGYYNDLKNGIHETTEYLELFLRNLLLNESNPLHNRTLHISGTFKETEKPDIEIHKPDIDGLKADIQNVFKPKTVSNILKKSQRPTYRATISSTTVSENR